MATNNSINNESMRSRYAFNANLSADISSCTGDGTVVNPVIFDSLEFGGADYNVATGLFTVPVNGKYRFDSSLWFTGITFASAEPIQVYITCSDGQVGLGDYLQSSLVKNTGALNDIGLIVSGIFSLNAGATVKIQASASGGTKIVNIAKESFFCGYLL